MTAPTLPPGQLAREDFPRFGLTPFAARFPSQIEQPALEVGGDALGPLQLDDALAGLPRVELTSDFHCVTTWSRCGLRWSGVRLADFYRLRVQPALQGGDAPRTVVMRAQDGYATTLPLADLLGADVLLADSLDGEPLGLAHGAPLRLVAPAHYGYKSVKHLSALEFWVRDPGLRPAAYAFMDHPRARVMQEERGRWLPGWLLRRVYRPLIGSTVRAFARALSERADGPATGSSGR